MLFRPYTVPSIGVTWKKTHFTDFFWPDERPSDFKHKQEAGQTSYPRNTFCLFSICWGKVFSFFIFSFEIGRNDLWLQLYPGPNHFGYLDRHWTIIIKVCLSLKQSISAYSYLCLLVKGLSFMVRLGTKSIVLLLKSKCGPPKKLKKRGFTWKLDDSRPRRPLSSSLEDVES